MTNEIVKELSKKYNPRFGQVSVENGYATSEQIKQAVMEQTDDDLANRPHRLIGRILLDKGWMTAQQIENVVNNMFGKK